MRRLFQSSIISHQSAPSSLDGMDKMIGLAASSGTRSMLLLFAVGFASHMVNPLSLIKSRGDHILFRDCPSVTAVLVKRLEQEMVGFLVRLLVHSGGVGASGPRQDLGDHSGALLPR